MQNTKYKYLPTGKQNVELGANHHNFVGNALRTRNGNFKRSEGYQTAIAVTLGILTLGIHPLVVFLIKKYEQYKTTNGAMGVKSCDDFIFDDSNSENKKATAPSLNPTTTPVAPAAAIVATSEQQGAKTPKEAPKEAATAPIEQSNSTPRKFTP